MDFIAYVHPEDIERWEKEGRLDIINRIRDSGIIWMGDRIIDKYGEKVNSCIYLNQDGALFSCEIYNTRPLVCRSYIPGSSEICPLYYAKK